MGWQTREHWRLGHRHLWLEELQDTFSAGWRIGWNGPAKREYEKWTNGKFEQPPGPDRHAAREILARRRMAEMMSKVEGDWQQVG